jgi:hypothetical protein
MSDGFQFESVICKPSVIVLAATTCKTSYSGRNHAGCRRVEGTRKLESVLNTVVVRHGALQTKPI